MSCVVNNEIEYPVVRYRPAGLSKTAVDESLKPSIFPKAID